MRDYMLQGWIPFFRRECVCRVAMIFKLVPKEKCDYHRQAVCTCTGTKCRISAVWMFAFVLVKWCHH